jgi:CRP-like cAMP-binding protein
VEQVYFVSDGLVSLVQLMPSGKYSETGLVGREGIVGVLVPLGSSATSHEAVVQIAGTAFRMRADALRRETSQRSAMTDILLRYVQAQFAQIAQSAACNNLHPVGLRLARWLLMASDSAETDNLALTHQLLCMMLGVRRSTVTTELAALKTKGLIATRMGGVTITNRPGLEAASCECYRTVCTEFRRLLGPPIFQDTVD